MKAIIFIFFMGIASQIPAQIGKTPEPRFNDPHFPARHQVNGGLITTYSGETPPPVLIADVTYGITEKLALGIVGGTTGAIGLYGVKFNAVLVQHNEFRFLFRMTGIYYPERNGKFLFDNEDKHVMPWMLSMWVVDAEWKTRKDIRWSFGIGAMETHCVREMKKWFNYDLFNTFHGSVSIPVSRRLIIRPEVIAVLKDWALIENGAFKVKFPVNPYVNIVYRF